MVYHVDRDHYAKCIEISKRVRWDIDKDVIRGRTFDLDKKFLPDGISKVDLLDFLSFEEKKLLSSIEGRMYPLLKKSTRVPGLYPEGDQLLRQRAFPLRPPREIL